MPDSDYDSVSLLVHFDGADSSTTFTDDGPIGHSVSVASGAAAVDTAQSVFGGASGLFPGADPTWLAVADHASLNLGNGDFTIELRFRISVNLAQNLVMKAAANFAIPSFILDRSLGGLVTFFATTNGSTSLLNSTLSTDAFVSTDTWYAVAVVRDGDNFYMYADGTKVDTAGASSAGASMDDSTLNVLIGGSAFASSFGRDLWIEELRITKGVARYTGASYTLDTTSFANEGEAVADYQAVSVDMEVGVESPHEFRSAARDSLIAMEVGVESPHEFRSAARDSLIAMEVGVEATHSFRVTVRDADIPMEVGVESPHEFISPWVGSATWPPFSATGDYESKFIEGDVTWPPFSAEGQFTTGTYLSASLTYRYSLSASTPMAASLTYRYALAGTMVSGAVYTGSLIAPGYSGSGTLWQDGLYIGSLRAPMWRVSAQLTPESLLTADLTYPRYRVQGTHLSGVLWSGAFTVPGYTVTAVHYGPYVLTASLVAPGWVLEAEMYATIAAEFYTWVMNARNKALTEYTGFGFTSYAVFRGVPLAAGAAGIVPLDSANDDDGEPIVSLVRTGKEGFGSSYNKRVPRLYVVYDSTGLMHFSVYTSQSGKRTYLLPANGVPGVQTRRVPIGRGPKSPHWQFEVTNPEGQDFAISSLQAYPEKGRRRVV